MDPSVLKEKFRVLQSTQDAINATADALIEHSSDARRIVKAWNEEFTSSSVSKKLTLLYLANDVLQRCKSNAFLPGFLHYLPKATAHLYKHGDAKIRAAVMRLVEVWTERKVLRNGIAAVRSQLDKVKDMPIAEVQETEDLAAQGSKRKRDGHPIPESLEDVEEAAKQRGEMEHLIAQLVKEREMRSLSREEVLKLKELSEKHCTLVKSEIQARKKTVDLLKSTLTEQEEGLQKSKEMLRLCFVRQEEIKKASATTELPTGDAFEPRGSISLNGENLESGLMPDDAPHSFEGPSITYPVSLMPPYPPVGPMAYGSHPQGQPIHPVTFSLMHPKGPNEKPQEHEMANLYHQTGPFLGQDYLPDAQAPPLRPYDAHVMHGLPGPYGHQLNFQGYPGQYDSDKDWRT